jgi:hypothetical protein
MLARIWSGATRAADADEYVKYLEATGLRECQATPGNKGYRGSCLLRRNAGHEVEFVTILLWNSIADIQAVAGPDYEQAVSPPERRQYLSRYDPKAAHYEVVG